MWIIKYLGMLLQEIKIQGLYIVEIIKVLFNVNYIIKNSHKLNMKIICMIVNKNIKIKKGTFKMDGIVGSTINNNNMFNNNLNNLNNTMSRKEIMLEVIY